ncbi:hypothetical protein KJJ36_13965 [Staphylococcus pseudoxylosus]|uniref:hypothetical protein n=1 Tax=Staphylococcus pseudoxylosus TaxID=2282419 RepID=UPI001F41397C|nr:hypothetical protein [Staphylococcus pseudoxylosus]MCE5003473.1 hypothetical protein [Staphylococcus pseudoxylosus]
MAENVLSNPKLSNEDRNYLKEARNEADFIERLTQLNSGLEISLDTDKAKKILRKAELLDNKGEPQYERIRQIIDVVYNTDYRDLDEKMIGYDENIHEAFYEGASYLYANSTNFIKGKIIPRVKRTNERVKGDVKAAGHIEEGSIMNGLIKLYKKIFK